MAIKNTTTEVAVAALRQGKVISFPTETVYGLGADAGNVAAICRIFQLKGRPADHPLIVHIADCGELEQWSHTIPAIAYQLAERFWPGALTLILPKASHVLPEITGGQETIALRVPSHPLALKLLREFGGGLAAPSANRFGRISPTCAAHVRDEFGDRIEVILDGGPCQIGLESTIISLINKRPLLLRPGGIAIKELQQVLGGNLDLSVPGSETVKVPGMLPSHYAPLTPLIMSKSIDLWSQVHTLCVQEKKIAVVTFSQPQKDLLDTRVYQVCMPENPKTYGQELYKVMRQLDNGKFDILFFEAPPDTNEWLTINNRLTRAAQQFGVSV